MIDLMLGHVLPFGALGALFGTAFFCALDWNVRLYIHDGAGGWSALFVHLVRLLAIGAAFALCARQGALPMLSCLAGFQMIRSAAVKRHRIAIGRNP